MQRTLTSKDGPSHDGPHCLRQEAFVFQSAAPETEAEENSLRHLAFVNKFIYALHDWLCRGRYGLGQIFSRTAVLAHGTADRKIHGACRFGRHVDHCVGNERSLEICSA